MYILSTYFYSKKERRKKKKTKEGKKEVYIVVESLDPDPNPNLRPKVMINPVITLILTPRILPIHPNHNPLSLSLSLYTS